MANINLDISEVLDIKCRRYDTFQLDMDWTDSDEDPIDLTGYTFKMQVRKKSTSASPVLTIDDDDFTKDANGNLTIEKSSADMNMKGGNYVYDLQATSSGVVSTWLKGMFVVTDDVTE